MDVQDLGGKREEKERDGEKEERGGKSGRNETDEGTVEAKRK